MMGSRLDVTTVLLFIVVVFPGMISINVYRVLMPARPLDWTTAVLQGLFYSAVNFVPGLPLLYLLLFGRDPLEHPVRYFVAALLVLIVMPMLWPMATVAAFKSNWLRSQFKIRYPTAWDFFFDRCKSSLVLVHMKNGALLAGLWGPGSYAGTFPNDGDIYLEKVYGIDEGEIGEPLPNTRGVLLRKRDYEYVEFFEVTRSKEGNRE
ncbi:MAG TPA: DUF6338 family protein [Longimicrobium sp.]|nr:DUF6338 family protein [Longimicrobium sp.]